MKSLLITVLILCLCLSGCGKEEPVLVNPPETTVAAVTEETAEETTEAIPQTEPAEYPDPQDLVFVAVADYIPNLCIDLKYAGTDNFTGQVIYDFSTAYLRYGTVNKLAAVQEDLEQLGLGLKLWDGFRPVMAQHKLWEVCPDSRYVANPKTGFSAHSRGNTVDVTIVDGQGRDVMMPTGFDDFTAKADRDYSDCPKEAADNAQILEALMEKHGFKGYKNEWWHFTDTQSYPVEKQFQPTT